MIPMQVDIDQKLNYKDSNKGGNMKSRKCIVWEFVKGFFKGFGKKSLAVLRYVGAVLGGLVIATGVLYGVGYLVITTGLPVFSECAEFSGFDQIMDVGGTYTFGLIYLLMFVWGITEGVKRLKKKIKRTYQSAKYECR